MELFFKNVKHKKNRLKKRAPTWEPPFTINPKKTKNDYKPLNKGSNTKTVNHIQKATRIKLNRPSQNSLRSCTQRYFECSTISLNIVTILNYFVAGNHNSFFLLDMVLVGMRHYNHLPTFRGNLLQHQNQYQPNRCSGTHRLLHIQ